MKVCAAVQHAHQKGIIHRDLKPTNILVTLIDGEAVPKVIDFGVAKALGQKLTEKTLFTAFQQMIGTPAYMSPEQAALSGVDVDTRSDIYSLGVLLYELLTGVTPFDADTLRKAALDEIRRLIRETEPPKPSTRLHDAGREADRSGPTPPHRANGTHPPGAWRPGLDRDEVPGEGPRAALRDGQCSGGGHPAPSEPRAGAGQSAGHGLSRPQIHPPPPVRRRDGDDADPGPGRWAGRRADRFRPGPAGAGPGGASGAAQEAAQRQRAEAGEKKAQAEASKSRQVARFLEDMLDGVGPAVARGRDTTMLREILDKTAERVEQRLKDQPEVEAELQYTMARVYMGAR